MSLLNAWNCLRGRHTPVTIEHLDTSQLPAVRTVKLTVCKHCHMMRTPKLPKATVTHT